MLSNYTAFVSRQRAGFVTFLPTKKVSANSCGAGIGVVIIAMRCSHMPLRWSGEINIVFSYRHIPPTELNKTRKTYAVVVRSKKQLRTFNST